TVLADQNDFRLLGDLRDAYDLTIAFGRLNVDHALAATISEAVLVGGSALAVTVFRNRENERAFDGDRHVGGGGFGHAGFGFGLFSGSFGLLSVRGRGGHADDVILFGEIHSAHSGGVASH